MGAGTAQRAFPTIGRPSLASPCVKNPSQRRLALAGRRLANAWILRCRGHGVRVCIEFFGPLPVPMQDMTVSEGNVVPLIMAVLWKVDPVVRPRFDYAPSVFNYKDRIVYALLMFIEERKGVARVSDLGVLRFDIRVQRE